MPSRAFTPDGSVDDINTVLHLVTHRTPKDAPLGHQDTEGSFDRDSKLPVIRHFETNAQKFRRWIPECNQRHAQVYIRMKKIERVFRRPTVPSERRDDALAQWVRGICRIVHAKPRTSASPYLKVKLQSTGRTTQKVIRCRNRRHGFEQVCILQQRLVVVYTTRCVDRCRQNAAVGITDRLHVDAKGLFVATEILPGVGYVAKRGAVGADQEPVDGTYDSSEYTTGFAFGGKLQSPSMACLVFRQHTNRARG